MAKKSKSASRSAQKPVARKTASGKSASGKSASEKSTPGKSSTRRPEVKAKAAKKPVPMPVKNRPIAATPKINVVAKAMKPSMPKVGAVNSGKATKANGAQPSADLAKPAVLSGAVNSAKGLSKALGKKSEAAPLAVKLEGKPVALKSEVKPIDEKVSDLMPTEPKGAEAKTPEKPEKKKRKDDPKIDRAGDLAGQWKTLFEKSKAIKPTPYKMSENYEARTPLMHKVLGWGYVLSSQNNRLEVLFQDGIKMLIANYKA